MDTFNDVNAPCCSISQTPCICDQTERVIRAIANGQIDHTMTDKQRAWCITEADRCGVVMYTEMELAGLGDKELAYSVLNAWSSYVACNCL